MSQHTLLLTGGKPWGFRMKGGNEFNLPISVEHVSHDGNAGKGGLRVGDSILSVNGKSLTKVSHEQAKNIISNSGSQLELLVFRDPNLASHSPSTSASRVTLQKNFETNKKTEEDAKTSPLVTETLTAGSSGLNLGALRHEQSSEKLASPASSISSCGAASSNPSQVSNTEQRGGDLSVTGPRSITPLSISAAEPSKSPVKMQDDPKVGPLDKLDLTSKTKISTGLIRICEVCKEKILDSNFVKLGEKAWHPAHFCCVFCKVSLVSTGFFEQPQGIMCKNCYGETMAPKCAACHKPCISEHVKASDRSYHVECFLCAKCSKSLRGISFNMHDGKPHCMDCINEQCSQKCSKCHENILPGHEYIEALNKLFHQPCFTCSVCNCSLSAKPRFQVKNGQPCCPEH